MNGGGGLRGDGGWGELVMHLMGFLGGKSMENSRVEISDAWSLKVSGVILKRFLDADFEVRC